MTKQQAIQQIGEWESQRAHIASEQALEVLDVLNLTAVIPLELTQEQLDGGVAAKDLFNWIIQNSALGGF